MTPAKINFLDEGTVDLSRFQFELKVHECFKQGTRDIICRINENQLFLSVNSTGNIRQSERESKTLKWIDIQRLIQLLFETNCLEDKREYFNPGKAINPRGICRIGLDIRINAIQYNQTHFGDRSQLEQTDFLQFFWTYIEAVLDWPLPHSMAKIANMRKAVA